MSHLGMLLVCVQLALWLICGWKAPCRFTLLWLLPISVWQKLLPMCLQLQDSESYEFDDCFTRCVLCCSETPDILCHMRILHPGCGSMDVSLHFISLLCGF